ncbi:MAG: DUF979 family protein [Sphingomonadaceae bacterium]|nr:DUF979 family protein [Sphingomonadaceae bacterium]
MIEQGLLFVLAGAVFLAFAAVAAVDRRYGAALFWGLIALGFLAGDRLGDRANGVLALTLAVLAGSGALRRSLAGPTDDASALGAVGEPSLPSPAHPTQPAARPPSPAAGESARSVPPGPAVAGWRLFGPVLIVPAVTLIGTLVFKRLRWGDAPLVAPAQETLVALGLAAVTALAAALCWLRARPVVAARAGEGIMDAVGWAAALPQWLAALGAVLALAGVGRAIGDALGPLLPEGARLAAVLVFGLGMALLTVAFGNAFAAFPVMMAAVGYPFLIVRLGGDPAVIGAVGMLCGFCGTLVTPMAANFNIVPAALLDLPRYAVIRAQWPTAVPLLAVNLAILYAAAFR